MKPAPYRKVSMQGHEWPWTLSADHTAWYTIQMQTNRHHMDTVEEFLDPRMYRDLAYVPFYTLLWGLSANYRFAENVCMAIPQKENLEGYGFSLDFLRAIPTGEDFITLQNSVMELLAEADLVTISSPKKKGKKATEPVPEPEQEAPSDPPA